jgi:hypothetical protein
MRSRSGNPLATLLLSVPLLAMPLMAVFGVPQFVPVIASSMSEHKSEWDAPLRKAKVGESLAMNPLPDARSHSQADLRQEVRLADLFRADLPSRSADQPARHYQVEPLSTSEVSVAEGRPRVVDLFATEPGAIEPTNLSERPHAASTVRQASRDVDVRPGFSRSLKSGHERSLAGLTWRQAVRRLNDLGIHRFRLEPGHDAADFHFVCEFSPDNDSRITRRFEAEAVEPLQAVELVLRQIDEWNGQR